MDDLDEVEQEAPPLTADKAPEPEDAQTGDPSLEPADALPRLSQLPIRRDA